MALCFLPGVGITYAMAFDLIDPSPRYFGDATVLHRNGLFTGFPFLMAGVLIRRYQLQDRVGLPALSGLAMISILLVLAEGVLLFIVPPIGVNHDNMVALALACPVLVMLALKFRRQSQSKQLGVYANGLFFVHVAFVIMGFRYSELSQFWIYAMAVTGSLAVTWVLIRLGLARYLL
jgi:hypothetical protein